MDESSERLEKYCISEPLLYKYRDGCMCLPK